MFRPHRNPHLELAISLLILIGVSAGCSRITEQFSSNTGVSTAEDTNSRTSTEIASAETAGACFNEYYPIDTAASKEYTITGSAPSKYALTQSTNDEGTFTENRRFGGGMEMTSTWICTAEGLRNAEYNNLGTTDNASFAMETIKAEGVTFPRVWNLGHEWTTTYEVSANIAAGPVKAAASGTVEIVNEIVALDQKVTVPGGTFNTAKVDSEIRMNLTMRGQKVPSQPIRMTAWYAPQIGLVRQEVKSGFGNQTVEYAATK